MAEINQQATVNIEINSESAKHKIADLENKLADLNKKKKEFEKAGDYRGLAKVQKDLDSANRKLHNARTNAQKCEAALKKLNSASPKELRMTLKQLQNDLNYIERGSKAWNDHVQAIKRVKAEINAVDAELKEHQSLLQRANGFVNKWGMSIASLAASFTGLVMTARSAVQSFADIDAEMANVRKYTGMTAEEVEHLNEEFKNMDTRTSREQLNQLAQEAGRLGLQTEKDVMGFVKAADIINVALDDLGEGATLTLSKLTDIFGDKMKYGVEDSLLKVGSVINELSQNCTASAPYLADFAQRLAGVGKQANMTIPEIMGFAAVLDSNGQALEMSATAVSQLIMKMFQDPAKIAKATGMDLKKFNALLKKDTNEALLMLLERLNSLGNIDVLAPVFAAMGTDGARASQVLAALAGNIDMVKKQQQVANKAFQDGTSAVNEFNVQNNTVQAQLDKAKKGFLEVAISLGQKLAPAMKYAITGGSALMRVMSSLITFISKNKALIVSLAGAIAAYTVIIKANTIANAASAALDKVINGLLAARKIVVLACSAAYNTLTGNTTRAAAAQQMLNNTLKASPWGLAMAGASLLMGAIIKLGESYKDTQAEAKRLAEEHRKFKESIEDIDKASNEYSANELTRLKSLYLAATDENKARNERIEAVRTMQNLYPAIFSNFTTEQIMAGKAKEAYDKLTLSIIANAKARAAAEKIMENEKAILDLEDEVRKNRQAASDAGARADQARQQQRDNANKNSSQHAFMPTGVQTKAEQDWSNAIRDNTEQQKIANQNAARAENEIKERRAANERLAKIPGVDAVLAGGGEPATPPKINYTPTDPKAAAKAAREAKAAERARQAEEKKRKQEEERQKRLAAALEKKEFKDALEAVKKNLLDQNTAADKSYHDGELSYQGYLDKLHSIAQEYYTNAIEVYKNFGAEESDEVAKLRADQEKEAESYYSNMKKLRLEILADNRDNAVLASQMDFYDPNNNEAYRNQRLLDEKIAQINLQYFREVLAEQTEGTKEYYDAEKALDRATKEEELRKRKQLEENLQEWLATYNLLGAKERMATELKVADELYKNKADKEEEYQQVRAAIIRKYRDQVNEQTGTTAQGQGFSDAAYDRDTALANLEKARQEGLLEGEEDYQHRRWQIIKGYHDKVKELVSSEGSEWGSMVTNLVESFRNAFENMGTNLADILKSIEDMAAATFAIMGAGLESWTNYSNAQRDLEIANITKNYDERIKAAGNNDKKTKKLEEQKQAEIAKIKNKYNKRAQAIELAQAVASTAMAAINAYASAAQVPMIGYIIAPIAAAMALAAGGLQIAAIRKQHQAEAAGYYEGGFTARDRNNRREVGVVHANEFVANHEAVANPQLAPVLRLIDQAQRNNTVGSLTSEDVSRAIGQGSILGEMTASQRTAAAEREANMAVVAAAMAQQSAAIAELNQRLAEGIESYMVMDGERGFEKYWENYQALKQRPQR